MPIIKVTLLTSLLLSPILHAASQEIGLKAQQQGDYPTAAQHFQKACYQGDLNACNSLGNLYNLGKAYACGSLAYLYAEGLGTTQNTPQAIEFYTQGCDADDMYSCGNLGYYYEGIGVEQNYATAIELYTKACNLGDEDACKAVKELEQSPATPNILTTKVITT